MPMEPVVGTEAGREMRPAEEVVKVWDPFVRVFHWSLVVLFAAAWASEEWPLVHERIGYGVMGLVAMRIVWGFVGPRTARFSDFIRPPAVVMEHIAAIARGAPGQSLGHNPVGGLMVLALLAALLATGLTGWLTTTDLLADGDLLEEVHEALATLTLALVGVHVLGVIFMSVLTRDNLVRAMITGRKRRRP
ncbi:MAG: cytochrome b/b6 domain-containing protein [Hyphomicrobiaceae bacterium]